MKLKNYYFKGDKMKRIIIALTAAATVTNAGVTCQDLEMDLMTNVNVQLMLTNTGLRTHPKSYSKAELKEIKADAQKALKIASETGRCNSSSMKATKAVTKSVALQILDKLKKRGI